MARYIPLEYEIISYQAVQVPDIASSSTSSSTANKSSSTTRMMLRNNMTELWNEESIRNRNQSPNLGIWDCRMMETNNGGSSSGDDLVAHLLSAAVSGSSRTTTTNDGKSTESKTDESNKTTNTNDDGITFIVTIDMEDPTTVHAAVEGMVRTVTTFFERRDSHAVETAAAAGGGGSATTKVGGAGTTPLSQLQSIKFGMPHQPIEEPTTTTTTNTISTQTTSSTTTNTPTNQTFNLLLCAILPPSSTNTTTNLTYRDRQARHLVSYHLQKYASELNCTLCFLCNPLDEFENVVGIGGGGGGRADLDSVDGDGSDDDEEAKEKEEDGGVVGMRPLGITVERFSDIVRNVCLSHHSTATTTSTNGGMGSKEEPTKELSAETTEGSTILPSVYEVGTHDAELIHSVFLRNASCPGVWDAAKDPLWVALKTNGNDGMEDSSGGGEKGTIESKNAKGAGGDDIWLGKLADSVSSSGIGSFTGGGGDSGSVRSGRSGKSGSVRSATNSSGGGGTNKVPSSFTSSSGSTSGGGRSGSKTPKKMKKKPPVGGGGKKTDNKNVSDFFSDLLKK